MPSVFDRDDFNDRLFFPRADVTRCPPGAEDLRIEVKGAVLRARLHHADERHATVLFFHGNGEVVADYDAQAARYRDLGAALLVVDFRGYGGSTGTPTLRHAIEDALTVHEAVHRKAQAPVIVMGRSLGAMCAHALYATRDPRIAGFVLESGTSQLSRFLERRGLPADTKLSDDERKTFDPLWKLKRGNQPLLVLHGKRDDLIRPDEARAAFDAAGTPAADKKLVWVEGKGHNDLFEADGYWSALRTFVAERKAG